MHHLQKHARHAGFSVRTLALSISACAMLSAAPSAIAENIEHVQVIGQAVSLDKALKEQRSRDSVSSVVHADGISQLPDDNAAEALQRLPGVATERDQGEGRFVSVRGISPDLNSVTINGARVPAPESGRRAVALDVLPAELVQSLSVIKTLTPDMDANSLGGTVEVESLSAFDHKGAFYSVSGEVGQDDNTGETSPKFSGAASNVFSVGRGDKNLGVAAALSWQEREFGSDNVETGGEWDFEDGARLEEFEQRDYRITRERLGVGVNVDFKPDQTSNYYLRTLHSEFKDTETRHANIVEFDDALAGGETGDAEVSRELKDREETQQIDSIVVGGERNAGLWTLSAQAGHSKASEDSPLHIPGATFEAEDTFEDVSYSGSRIPRLNIADGFYSAENFSLDSIEIEKQLAEDTDNYIKADIARDYTWAGHAAQVKTGFKASRREKTNDLDAWAYEDFEDAGIDEDALSLSSHVNGTIDYSLGRFGPGINAGSLKRIVAQLDAGDFYDETESLINDYQQNENTNAAYVMNRVDIDDLQLIVGVRYESTDFKAQGNESRTFENEDEEEITELGSTRTSTTDDYWLPGVHARIQLNKQTQIRGAFTQSVVRPTFEQTSPGVVIDGDEAEFGNPSLRPLESNNIDVGIERYFGHASVVSAFLFYKDVRNFAYATDVAGTGEWEDFDEALTFTNGDSARLHGIELAYSQKFTRLPSPWNGLLVGVNATFSDSTAVIAGYDGNAEQMRTRDITLPDQADTVGNLMLGWESDVFTVRVAANYKSESLFEVGTLEDKTHDLYADAQTFVDLSAQYRLAKGLFLNAEAQNITDEVYYTYVGRSTYNAQYEEYGPTYKLGVTYTDF